MGEIEMKVFIHELVAIPVVTAALVLGGPAYGDGRHDATKHLSEHTEHRKTSNSSIIELSDARLKIELNATDGDAGIQVFIDADPWKDMRIFDPYGKLMFRSVARGRFGLQGGTELFMESAEPDFSELSLDEFLAAFSGKCISIQG